MYFLQLWVGSEAGSSQVGQLSADLGAFLSFAVRCPCEPTRAAAVLGGISNRTLLRLAKPQTSFLFLQGGVTYMVEQTGYLKPRS